MKKLAVLLGSALCSLNVLAAASPSWCGYKDAFHLAASVEPGVKVAEAIGDSDVVVEIIGERAFSIRDSASCVPGYARVAIVYDNTHFCRLLIQDGPYMNHPEVKDRNCQGMMFQSMDYEGSHSYAIKVAPPLFNKSK